MKTGFLISAALALCAALPFPGAAQERLQPQWMRKLPAPSNPSFEYITIKAAANSLQQARKDCLNLVFDKSGYANGVLVKVDEQSRLAVDKSWTDGKFTDSQTETFIRNSEIKGGEFKVYVKEVTEHYEVRDGIFEMTKLYQKSVSDETPSFDAVTVTDRYGFAPVLMSIIPGCGQFRKGDILKGSLFLGGVSATAIGTAVLMNLGNDMSTKMTLNHNANDIMFYSNMANTYRTCAYVCIGLGAAIYVYNLIDAAAAPGAKRLIVTPGTIGLSF